MVIFNSYVSLPEGKAWEAESDQHMNVVPSDPFRKTPRMTS